MRPPILAVMVAAATLALYRHFHPPQAAPALALAAPDLLVNVAAFLQDDARWGDDDLAGGRFGDIGCAVTSLAMVAAHHGFAVTPGALNAWLREHGGYTKDGWVHWGRIEQFTGGRLALSYAGGADDARLARELAAGRPVVVKVLVGKVAHWVVVVGRDRGVWYVRDPLDETLSILPITRYSSGILAMRAFAGS